MRLKKRKIVQVGPLPPTVGGITAVMNTILSSSLNEKYEIIPFTTSRPTLEVIKNINDYNILFHMGLSNLVKSLLITIKHILFFPLILIIKKPDIIHIHTSDYWMFWESLIYISISKIFRKKIILHVHAHSFNVFYEAGGDVQKKIINITLLKSDQVIVLSKLQKEFFKKFIPYEKLMVVPNVVDLKMIDEYMKNDIDKGDKVNVLFIGGTEAKRKGIYDVIKAIPIVVEKFKGKVMFVFLGRCEIEKLQTMCKKNNVSEFVRFLGFVEEQEKYKVLRSSHIFVLPSYAEGLPIAILEAMYIGLPIISTRVGSIPEVIEDGNNGYLISPGDYCSLAEKIVDLSSDQMLRERMGDINRDTILKDYNISSFVEKLENIYNFL
jgi:glycosyltransferase involved in cell wall biosynthesis